MFVLSLLTLSSRLGGWIKSRSIGVRLSATISSWYGDPKSMSIGSICVISCTRVGFGCMCWIGGKLTYGLGVSGTCGRWVGVFCNARSRRAFSLSLCRLRSMYLLRMRRLRSAILGSILPAGFAGGGGGG